MIIVLGSYAMFASLSGLARRCCRSAAIDGDADSIGAVLSADAIYQQPPTKRWVCWCFRAWSRRSGRRREYGGMLMTGAPARHYLVQGGSAGLTAGARWSSEVIMFMTTQALVKFVSSRGWIVGAQTGIAVVEGRGWRVRLGTLSKPVLGFVFSENGLIGDISSPDSYHHAG